MKAKAQTKARKLLSALLTCAVLFTSLVFTVSAEEVVSAGNELELVSLVKILSTGTTVRLDGNIELKSPLIIPEESVLTLDLNGKTLSIAVAYNEQGEDVYYNTVRNSGNLTITGNGTIEGQWNAVSSYAGATITIENGTFNGIHGNSLYNAGNAAIKNGTFNGNPDNWDLFNEGGSVEIENGKFDVSGVCNDGGSMEISGGSFKTAVNFDTISGGTFKKASPKNTGNPAKVSGTVTGGIFDIDSWSSVFLKALENGNALENVKFTESAVSAFAFAVPTGSDNRLAAVSGFKFGDSAESDGFYRIQNVGTAKFTVAEPTHGEIKALSGIMKFLGASGKLPTNAVVTKGVTLEKGVDFQNVVAVPNDGYVFDGWYTGENGEGTKVCASAELQSFTMAQDDMTLYANFVDNAESIAFKAAYDEWIKDYDTQNTFTITNTTEMACLAYAVNTDGKNFAGKTVTLENDLVYTDTDKYTPVGDKDKTHVFKGTFDGQNHTISGIVSEGKFDYAGVFGNVNGTIRNLKVKDCRFYGAAGALYAGGIAAEALGKMENCSVENITVGGWYGGGMIGHSYAVTLENVSASSVTGEGTGKFGAIIGYADDLKLTGAKVSDISADNNLTGSIVGHINAGTHTISGVTVEAPTEGKEAIPAFGSAHSTTPKTIRLSGDNNITASKLIGSSMSAAKLEISAGTYTIDAISDKSGTADNIEISGGTFSIDVDDFCKDGYSAVKDGENWIVGSLASKVSVGFEVDPQDSRLYTIAVYAGNGAQINRLNTADLTFVLTASEPENSTVTYEIEPTSGIRLLNPEADRYEFHFDGKDAGVSDSGSKIVLGTVRFIGYTKNDATVNFAADKAKTLITATTEEDNVVSYYDGNGVIDSEFKIENVDFAVPTKKLTINITFPNAIEDQAATYQNMKVVISGGDLEKNLEYKLGSDGEYKLDANGAYVLEVADTLTENTAYTVTVSGAGYRTARYTVTMTGEKTLNFWNNVKDNAIEVETNNENSKKNVTFLAGDIVKDGKINIYDLSAVVSYFGESGLSAENHPEYAKYDLNRDGKIDSKDVAYVLVSWGK